MIVLGPGLFLLRTIFKKSWNLRTLCSNEIKKLVSIAAVKQDKLSPVYTGNMYANPWSSEVSGVGWGVLLFKDFLNDY